MQNLIGWFRLVRGFNLLMTAAAMYLFQYFVVAPLVVTCGLYPQLDPLHFFLLVLAVLLVMAGGNMVNDCFDFEQDREYKKQVPIGDIISLDNAFTLQFVFSVIGIAIGFYLAVYIGNFNLGYYFVFSAVFLWLYSMMLKKYFLIGNIVVAALTAFVFVLIVLFEPSVFRQNDSPLSGLIMPFVILYMQVYAGFAFLTTLTREIIKDAEDREADAAYGYKTLPVVLPAWATNVVLALLMLIAMLFVGWLQFHFWQHGEKKQFWYCLFFIQSQQLLNLVGLVAAREKFEYHNMSVFMKLLMVFGLLSMPLFRWFIVGRL